MKLIQFKQPTNFLQYVCMFAGSFATISSGINVGWTSPYLPYLLDPELSHIPTTSNEGSWLAVMPLIGAPIGGFIGSLLLDKVGRKNLVLAIAPIILACFLTMAYAETVLMLLIVRFILGSSEGALYMGLTIYYGEIADPKIRGFITSSISVSALIGTILINIIGPLYSIWATSLMSCVIPIVSFATFFWMPESPYYLIKIGKIDEAQESLQMLRGTDDIYFELKEIAAGVKRQESHEKTSFLDLFTVASNRKGLFIYAILCFTNKFSGKNPVVFYTTMIFAEAGGSVDSMLSVIIFSVMGLVATIVALCVIDRFGRRVFLLFSGFGCATALAGAGIYFTVQTFATHLLEYLGWLPLTSLLSYNVIFSLGLSFGPGILLSELFPTTIKAKALFVADTFNVVLGVTASKFFQVGNDEAGMYVPFWTFAICGVIGSVLIYFYVPETKGKSLEEIQLELIGQPKDERQQKV